MYVIALTGGIGSGKSLVSSLFLKLGIDIIDTDIIARELVTSGSSTLKKIEKHFGSAIIQDGELNRSELRKRIFANPAEKKWLENLLHPLIRAESFRRAKISISPYCILVIPLLFETSKPRFVDRVLVVESTEDIRIQRVIARDNSSKEEVEKIIHSQVSTETRRAGADDIIYNTGSSEEVEKQVKKLNAIYLKLVNSKRS